MSINKRIQSRREELEITQKDLAEKIGLNVSVMNRIESGERPARDDEIIKIAEVLRVTTDYLLGLTNNSTKTQSTKIESNYEFTTPEEAMSFLLSQEVIMGFGGFDIDKLSDEDKIQFANELLGQLKLLSYKYKK